jgi:uncharacterized phage-like protein YoqJ
LILQAYDADYRTFITGMAMGTDQWSGKIVAELKNEYSDIKLLAAVPFAGQSNIWRSETKQSWLNILTSCDEIYLIDTQPDTPITFDELINLSNVKNTDSNYTITHKLHKRNEWMVDRADAIIAVFKNTPGGTAKCIKYAQSKGKRVIAYNPNDKIVTKL